MIWVALLLAIAVPRNPNQKRAFMKSHPCPGGSDKGSTKRCRGYIVDHKVPLKRGGPDRPWNMQWQTIKDAEAKDKVE